MEPIIRIKLIDDVRKMIARIHDTMRILLDMTCNNVKAPHICFKAAKGLGPAGEFKSYFRAL